MSVTTGRSGGGNSQFTDRHGARSCSGLGTPNTPEDALPYPTEYCWRLHVAEPSAERETFLGGA